jgi:hypothetical protein
MTTNILSDKWEGDLAAPLDPRNMRFKPAKAPVYADCEGCLFIGQATPVCRLASELSVQRGGADCDDPHPTWGSIIYIKDKTDPRQLPLLKESI